jgi:hypothetical protein
VYFLLPVDQLSSLHKNPVVPLLCQLESPHGLLLVLLANPVAPPADLPQVLPRLALQPISRLFPFLGNLPREVWL